MNLFVINYHYQFPFTFWQFFLFFTSLTHTSSITAPNSPSISITFCKVFLFRDYLEILGYVKPGDGLSL